VLDLGAGPGTVLFAAAEIFQRSSKSHSFEADESWVALGKILTAQSFGGRRSSSAMAQA